MDNCQQKGAMSSRPPTDVKLVLLGNTRVGKTSLANMFVYGMFQEITNSSIGGHFMTKTLQTPKVILQICDTAAGKNPRCGLPDVTKGADCAILVYDLGNRESFQSVSDFWINYVKTNAPENVVTFLVGNKSDTDGRQVSDSEGRTLAERHGMLFIETSAKNRVNVDKVFVDAAIAAIETTDHSHAHGNCPSRLQLIEYGKEKQKEYCLISQ